MKASIVKYLDLKFKKYIFGGAHEIAEYTFPNGNWISVISGESINKFPYIKCDHWTHEVTYRNWQVESGTKTVGWLKKKEVEELMLMLQKSNEVKMFQITCYDIIQTSRQDCYN